VAVAGTAVFLAVVVALHFLQEGYDPAHQLMSELALGRYGAAMVAAFAGLAAAAFGIQLSLAPWGASRVLRGVLSAAAAAFLAAGLFPLGASSEVHIMAIACAFILSVVAMYLFPTMAAGAAPAAPRPFSWGMAAGVAISVALGHSVLPMGIGQRGAAFFLLLWMAVAGWRLHAASAQLPKSSGP
jgi:hypothetical protein